MTILNFPDEVFWQIFSHGFNPKNLAPVCKQFNSVINDLAYPYFLREIKKKSIDAHRFSAILQKENPNSEKIKQIFKQITTLHSRFFQGPMAKDLLLPIHPELELLSFQRFNAILKDIRYMEEHNSLVQLAGACHMKHQLNYEVEIFRILTLEEKKIWFQNPPPEIHRFFKFELNSKGLYHLPREIGTFHALKTLDLSRNFLRELPEEICKLNALTELDLTGNRLTDLPQGINELINLTSLHLGGNQLAVLPSGISRLAALQKLSLSGNPLQSFPEEVLTLTNLKSLNLSHSHFPELPSNIGNLSLLEYLSLQFCHLSSLPKSILSLRPRSINLTGTNIKSLPREFITSRGLIRALEGLSCKEYLSAYQPLQETNKIAVQDKTLGIGR